jgi:hypothetical protein
MRILPKIQVGLAALAASALPLSALGEGSLGDFRSKTEKWVETRQLISEERTEWQADRETMRATRDLLKERKASLEADIGELESTSTAADDERRELLLRRAELQRSGQVLKDRMRGLEEAVLALAPQLPEPLRDKLELLLVQVPDNPETTRLQLGQRLMNVLGVLAQAEKFNSTATFVGETRPLEDGQKVQVRTLYWGLGQAVYVDGQGRIAGLGRPGIDGWEFTNDASVAADAKLLLDIYEGNVDTIEFVRLPIETDESL